MILRYFGAVCIFILNIQSTYAFNYLNGYSDKDYNSEKLEVLRNYLVRFGNHERAAEEVYNRRTFEPEDNEIDAIGRKLINENIPQSQPETIPEVVQKLPDNLTKQSRVSHNKEIAHSPLVQSSDRTRGNEKTSDVYFIALVAACSIAAVCGVMAAGFCWYKLQKNAKAAAAADYPAYGVTGPSKEEDLTSPPSGDRKLAQNAHMYHYQHQKQQMIAIDKANGDRQASTSDLDSEEENEDGDYTVYECAGLAPTGEMEVKNPLFQDEPPLPPSPPIVTKDQDK